MIPVFTEGMSGALAALSATARSVLITDATKPDNPIIYANAAFSALCGYTQAEIIGWNCRFLQGPDTDPAVAAELRAAIASGVAIHCEILNYRKDGSPFWNDLTIDPIRDASGLLTGFIGIQHEVSAAHFAKEAAAEAENRLNSIASHIPGYLYRRIMRTDGTIDVVYSSPSLRRLLGLGDADVLRPFYDYVHPDDHDGVIAAVRASGASMSLFREEFRLVPVSGPPRWLRSEAPPRRMANGEIVWDGLAIEVSAEKRWEGEIADLALHDVLTGLLNRAAWRRSLAMQLNDGNAAAGRCGLLCIDIEAFRDLNDRHGQPVGDAILRQVAQRIATIAASVNGISARLGGDEFGILMVNCPDVDALSCLAARTGEALAQPMQLGGHAMIIRTCIGAAFDDERPAGVNAGDDAGSELMTKAELALRWAKQDGRNASVVYSTALDDRFQNRAILARSLGQAILDDELELHYQPLVDLASGRIVSAEALVRWNHPTLGMQRPDLFIPLAEESGLIVQLGQWVLKQAVQQRMAWQEAGLAPPPISINVSGSQLIGPGFTAFADETLKCLHADAKDFEIELTEGELIEPSPQVMASLHTLRGMGFDIAIDDFGSGHASFRYLRDFPVDRVKIDQIFVRKLVLESTDALIIRAIVSLARGMGIGLVAEGIETEMQREFLQREGCEVGQGYFFSMPLVAEDFAWLLGRDVKLPLAAYDDEVAGIATIDPDMGIASS